MKLYKILDNLAKSSKELIIKGLQTDSRAVKPGDLFLAYIGEIDDGRHYIEQAVKNGAVAVAFDSSDGYVPPKVDVPCIPVEHLKQKLGKIAATFYGEPANDLTIIGVTGTNGKTSCVYFLAQLLTAFRHNVGILSTIGNGVYPDLAPSLNTTVGAIAVQKFLAEFKKAGCKYVCMEVSSHSLMQSRISCVKFNTVVFTNLSRDHLDYHHDMEQYFQAKSQLFHFFHWKHAIINIDDAFGKRLFKTLVDNQQSPLGYTLQPSKIAPVISFSSIRTRPFGFSAVLNTFKSKKNCDIPVLGTFNLYNVLAAIGAVLSIGMKVEHILKIIPTLKMPTGRMEVISQPGKPSVVIDFAHTPDALKKVLKALRPFCQHKLWCIFGCGGERDEGKRAQMARTVEQYADCIVLTSDNPRGEPVERIMSQTRKGFSGTSQVYEEPDRKKAIEYAINRAKPGSMILIAGKGHESYQEIAGVRYPFSDHDEVKKYLH